MDTDFPTAKPGLARDSVTVSELNRMVAGLIERSLPMVSVRGEISNFVRAASGHCYFTLKDPGAQVRAVMFRGRAQALDFAPREGLKVEIYASASLYPARGDFQLQVESMRQAGAGDLYQQFLRLKARLQAEGLFDAALKRSPPERPAAIAVVSSAQAAALRDVLVTLRRRAPQIPVTLFPALVQGAQAPAALIRALEAANRFALAPPPGEVAPQVLLLVRGGGAIEDLWAFNDEALARAIRASALPVICGVGHESDVTIADFAADLRAATPTAAAVAASPDMAGQRQRIAGAARDLQRAMQRQLLDAEQGLDLATRRLRSPLDRLRLQAQRLQAARHRLGAAGKGLVEPDAGIERLARRMALAAGQRLRQQEQRCDALAAQLQLISPLAVLDRGYAILSQEHIIRRPDDIDPSRPIEARLAQGQVRLRLSPE